MSVLGDGSSFVTYRSEWRSCRVGFCACTSILRLLNLPGVPLMSRGMWKRGLSQTACKRAMARYANARLVPEYVLKQLLNGVPLQSLQNKDFWGLCSIFLGLLPFHLRAEPFNACPWQTPWWSVSIEASSTWQPWLIEGDWINVPDADFVTGWLRGALCRQWQEVVLLDRERGIKSTQSPPNCTTQPSEILPQCFILQAPVQMWHLTRLQAFLPNQWMHSNPPTSFSQDLLSASREFFALRSLPRLWAYPVSLHMRAKACFASRYLSMGWQTSLEPAGISSDRDSGRNHLHGWQPSHWLLCQIVPWLGECHALYHIPVFLCILVIHHDLDPYISFSEKHGAIWLAD